MEQPEMTAQKNSIESTPAKSGTRLFYIDNIRLLVIIFVVTVHIACMYSGIGNIFYYAETKKYSLLGLSYIMIQQAYFMGLLFLLAGYFVPGSYSKKGFGKFIGDRAVRLLIPTLIYMVILMPIVKLVILGNPLSFSWRGFLTSYGVMWFAVALFIFSAIYAIVRKLSENSSATSNAMGINLTTRKLWLLVLLIAFCAFAIRQVFPIGTAQFGMELCYFASYIILFVIGTYAKKHGLFSQISYRSGKHWLIAGVIVGVLGYVVYLVAASLLSKLAGGNAHSGLMEISTALYAIWESFVAVAICTGLLGVFKEKFNRQNKLVKAMSNSSFAVYVLHAPIIVGIAVLAAPITIPLFLKWLIMCVICVPLCFAVAWLIRKIPGANKIL